MNELEKIEDKLHEAGFKLTPQRRATVELLLNHHTEHLTAGWPPSTGRWIF